MLRRSCAAGIVLGMRRAAVGLAVLAGLALAPAAAALTTLAGAVQNTVVPATLVTQAGTELISFESPVAGTISVSRNRAAPKAVVTGDPIPGRTQLVQQPNGAIQLYFPNAQGVGRLTSTEGQHSMNTYIYAPKDDPYHRKLWREPYPAEQMERLRALAAAARENFA